MTTVSVRLFAALRELAGDSRVQAEGRTVGEVLASLSERYGERFASVARAGAAPRSPLSYSLRMRRFDRVLLIVNPVARTVSRPTMAVIEKALSADFKLEVLETAERGHATEVAAQAALDGLDLVVVFSGDGTINEVVNGLAGTEAVLGVIPGGATNILAQALGMPLDPVE